MSAFLTISRLAKPSDYTISTWLLLGASIQSILVVLLPWDLSLLPPVLLIAYRILRGYLVAIGRLPNPVADDVTHGRQTWQYPSVDGTLGTTASSDSIVVLVLAASWTHPNGRFSPGSAIAGGYFQSLWRDAAANREKYGFLGNTPGMATEDSDLRPDEQGKTLLYLSYWKSLEGLRKFAHAEAHMKGQLWWEKGAKDEFPHIGFMHETYEVPAGSWENIFHNFRPFGIANAKYPVLATNNNVSKDEKAESVQWVSGLRPANPKQWRTMLSRMGRKA